MAEDFVFKVNLGGMIDLLSNHLYSSPDVFVRELLQNGSDAISAAAKNNPEYKSGKITISVDNGKSIVFTDTGTGLTEDEIHKFLAVIGQSSKHDITSGKLDNDYIGRFGIGLLSCFLVTDEITVYTRSIKESSPSLEWKGRPDGTYSIKKIETQLPVGTSVFLKSKSGCEEYYDDERISKLVRYYGMPLPYPIYVGSEHINRRFEAVNGGDHEDIMQLGETLFEERFLDYIPLESPSGLFSGIAYILPYYVSPTSKHTHRIYLKNMLLTESGDKLLPQWAFFLRCFINTKGLRPTASREDFYEDDALECARQELSQCISDYLQQLEWNNKRLLSKIISVHSLAIKSIAAENDELFKTFIPYLTFETSSGEMTGKQLEDYKGSIVYTNVVDTFRQMAAVYMAQDELLVNAGYVYEQALIEKMAVINSYMDISIIHMECIDELLSDVTEKERIAADRFVDTANEIMDEYDCQIDIRHFQPSQLPSLFAVNEDAKFLRDINHSKEVSNELFSDMLDTFAEQHRDDASAKLYLNMDNELIQKLITADDEKKIKCYIEILYVQSLLAGNFPMRKGELKLLNDNLLILLEWSAGI